MVMRTNGDDEGNDEGDDGDGDDDGGDGRRWKKAARFFEVDPTSCRQNFEDERVRP